VFDRFVLAGTASATFTAKLAGRIASLEGRLASADARNAESSGRLESAERDARQAREETAASSATLEQERSQRVDFETRLRTAVEALTASQRDADQVRASSARLSAQLEEEQAQHGHARKGLDDTRAQVAALQDELARQQAAYETLTTKLTDHQRRFEAVVQVLVERQRAQDSVTADLLTAQARIADLARDLTHSQADVLYLRQSYTECHGKLAAATAAYRSIAGSRSWRMTAPMRALFEWMRRVRSALRRGPALVARAPRRAAKGVLLSALDHLRAHPRRKESLARIIRRSPRLDARLRRFAWANPASEGGVRAPLPPVPPPRAAIVPRVDVPATPVAMTGDALVAAAGAPSADRFRGAGPVEQELRRSLGDWPLGTRRNV
jgi:hypothetical protein